MMARNMGRTSGRLICSLIHIVLLLIGQEGRVFAFHDVTIRGGSRSGQRTNVLQHPHVTRLHCSAASFKNVQDMLDSFHEGPLLISFHAVNCGPCRLQRKELRSLSRLVPEFRMVSIDTNRWPQVGSHFSVGKLPCLVIYKDGEVMDRLEGLVMAEDLAQMVRTHMIGSPTLAEDSPLFHDSPLL